LYFDLDFLNLYKVNGAIIHRDAQGSTILFDLYDVFVECVGGNVASKKQLFDFVRDHIGFGDCLLHLYDSGHFSTYTPFPFEELRIYFDIDCRDSELFVYPLNEPPELRNEIARNISAEFGFDSSFSESQLVVKRA
jgi:hypothetical protein